MVSPIISLFFLFSFNLFWIVIALYICLFYLSMLVRLMNWSPGLVFFLINLSHIFDFLCTFQTFHFSPDWEICLGLSFSSLLFLFYFPSPIYVSSIWFAFLVTFHTPPSVHLLSLLSKHKCLLFVLLVTISYKLICIFHIRWIRVWLSNIFDILTWKSLSLLQC